ncbi:PASTA domain-containing protein [Paludibacter sp. 221]|uniref:penicillin-binding protein n=1 Tax=Paludibacter sp. 221 TaxID=2302939 RepID=UPI0013D38F0F|nr:penicillin-binding protein [Paludibacter sp. 221]NDV47573.1 PASTA domain-containing protein [Paludibacter sp. 221]
MADKRTNIIIRFGIMYSLIVIAFVLVIAQIIIIQTKERDNWLALQYNSEKSTKIVPPNRGNIYSHDGRLLASSIPTYEIFLETTAANLRDKNGKVFYEKLDSVSESLSLLFKDRTKEQYKAALKDAYDKKKRYFKIYPGRIQYYHLKEVEAMPLFKLGRIKSGLIVEEKVRREKPFGSLANITIGDVFGNESQIVKKDTIIIRTNPKTHKTDTIKKRQEQWVGLNAKYGLEKYYNDYLNGEPGYSSRQKLTNLWQTVIEAEPIDGNDIYSTIDVDIQDISENVLVETLEKFNAVSGYAIFMETKTGEVKSIVNMYRNASGKYYEKENGAVTDIMEPGSTFKTIALIAALDDGKIKITDSIDVGDGRLKYHSRVPEVTDHNARKGGYGKISVANVIHGSSNVGMHKIIVDAYGNDQGAFIDRIRSTKIGEPMNLEFIEAQRPRIKHPNEKNNWSTVTSLSAMSRGYEVQVPPIYILTYYNAIANNGKMIRPIFVKSIAKDGQTIKKFSTETINNSICKPSTLADIQEVLLGVVEGEMGTGKDVRSQTVHIAGKTGTARVIKDGVYSNSKHRVSFCGYFPAENPQYTGIVVINEPNVSSAGLTSGVAFKNTAERIMALKSDWTPKLMANDTTIMKNTVLLPNSKDGNYKDLQTVMKNVRLPISGESGEWVKSEITENETTIKPLALDNEKIPDVRGMGAKNAIYLLENMGLNVQINGRGKVVSQNILAGTQATKGRNITLTLR